MAIAELVYLALTGSATQKEDAAYALAHLAAGNPENKEAIREAGGIAPLITLITLGSETAKEYAASALGNLAAGNLENKKAICTTPATALTLLSIDFELLKKITRKDCSWLKHYILKVMKKTSPDAPTTEEKKAFIAAIEDSLSTAYQLFATANRPLSFFTNNSIVEAQALADQFKIEISIPATPDLAFQQVHRSSTAAQSSSNQPSVTGVET